MTNDLQLVYRERRRYSTVRRSVDVAVAVVALIVTSPLLAAAAAAITLDDGGPIFFRQRRVGRFGQPFTIYKFRTMRLAACADAYKPGDGADPRITRVGRLLRKLSIDELPQFLNVVRGEMAVVGPRPEMPFIVARYERWQHLRLLVPPGITGLWQTTVRSTIPLERPEATMIDLAYVRRSSTPFDLSLVARTIGTILFPRGAF
jgi:lipopolysaccharide/colanic/teichoic acid biosynthesis glycosyltransferase